jgi:hypothetical protein
MRRAAILLRTGVFLAAVVAGLVAAPGLATAEHPQHGKPFFVVADDCWMGYTEGLISWRAVHPPEPVVVDVSGAVFDRYRYEGAGCSFICAPEICDDGLATAASFTAYAGNVVVDREQQRVDNGVLRFSFMLGDEPPPVARPIDQVVIQVCRFALAGNAATPVYCGKPQTFYPVP